MPELNDHELLAEFARGGSEPAFAGLVARHANLVYSAALRFSGNPHHAEEITQAVFVILARKAGTLSPRLVLSGWLYQTARLTAANFLKGEIRRQQREQEAYMQSTLNESEPAAWKQLAPLLDEAMGRLGETDRNVVVLRYFENQPAAEVAAALKMTEAAAHKRLNRALEKLRKIFGKRGVTLTAALIAGAVSANSVQAAPAGLAAAVTVAAQSTTLSATLTTLVKGTMKTMTWLKIKFTVGVALAALLAGGVVTVAVSQTGSGDRMTPQAIAQKTQAAYAALSSYNGTGTIVATVGNQTIPTTFSIRLQRPNLYRIEWTQTTQFFTNGGIAWSAGTGDFMVMSHGSQAMRPEKFRDRQTALAAAAGVSGQASSTIPGAFFQQNGANILKIPPSGQGQFIQQKDEFISGVDCYVISVSVDSTKLPNQGKLPGNAGKIGKRTTTLWIGKRDFLIHQAQTTMEGAVINLPLMSDATIKTTLERQNQPVTPEAIAAFRTQLETANRQAESVLASGKVVFTQTHENIVVNQDFSPADFAH